MDSKFIQDKILRYLCPNESPNVFIQIETFECLIISNYFYFCEKTFLKIIQKM